MKIAKKIFKALLCLILGFIVLVFCTHFGGRVLYGLTPEGGINESMYIDINGSKQWVNIYGKDLNNPVLLYLHGGPGSVTSEFDYVITRQWADVYTVVTWDQRDAGKSFSIDQRDTYLTAEMFMEDGKQITEFIRDYLNVEKITLLGHSWGTLYGANLVLAYPDYYEAFIGTGQLIDFYDNELAFKEKALEWSKDDPEYFEMASSLDPTYLSDSYFNTRNALMNHFGYNAMVNGADYDLYLSCIMNPNYSISDWLNYRKRNMDIYTTFLRSNELQKMSLKGRYEYKVPYYNINGDRDYQTNYEIAEEYFEKVEAPKKKLYYMENMTHGLLMSRSKDFSLIIHEIARSY